MHEGLPEPGDVVAGKYVVERPLGRGGMGAVYSVSHQLTGKRLALKCLLPLHANNPSVVERFVREARAAGRIQHRHVIDVFDVGRDGPLLYLVMPLLEGKSLADLLHDERLTLDEALRVLVRAMEGVAAAHAVGILHRDLKPGNIFVCVGPSGNLDDPRVLDFGISKLEGELESSLTRSGVTVGTPYYMALEQLTGQRDVDQRVDVYAMGVILYEAIVGQPPFTAENVAALAIKLMHTPPLHIAAARPDLPSGLANVIMRALARDRDARFRDIRELIDAITPYIAESANLHTSELPRVPLRTPRELAERLPTDIANASSPTEPRTMDALRAEKAPAQAIRSAHPAARPRGRLALATAIVMFALLASVLLFEKRNSNAGAPPVRSAAALRDAGAPVMTLAPALSPPPKVESEAARADVVPAPPSASPVLARPRKKKQEPAKEVVPPADELPPAVVAPQASEPPPAQNMRAGALAPEEF